RGWPKTFSSSLHQSRLHLVWRKRMRLQQDERGDAAKDRHGQAGTGQVRVLGLAVGRSAIAAGRMAGIHCQSGLIRDYISIPSRQRYPRSMRAEKIPLAHFIAARQAFGEGSLPPRLAGRFQALRPALRATTSWNVSHPWRNEGSNPFKTKKTSLS